jgi:predicted nucleic acid-binding protein
MVCNLIADTSFLASLFIVEDINHNKALELFSKYNHYIILNVVLNELITVMIYKKGLSYTKAVYNQIKYGQVFSIYYLSENDEQKSHEFLFANNKKISCVDACVIYISKIKESDILTFDKQMTVTKNLILQ